MGLTEIPSRTDESLGREKHDTREATNLDLQIPAAEYNRLLDYVIALAEAVGLRDGTTPDSIEQRLRSASPIAHAATFLTGDGGSTFQPDPDTIYTRPGEHEEVLIDASAYDIGGAIQIDYGSPASGAPLPTDRYIVLVTPHGGGGVFTALQRLDGADQYHLLLLASGSVANLTGFDLTIIYQP